MRASLATVALLVALHADATTQELPITVAPGSPPGTQPAPVVEVVLGFDAPIGDAAEVIRLTRPAPTSAWYVAQVVRTRTDGRTVRVLAPPGVDTLLVIKVPGRSGYLLDGPFHWPARPSAYRVRAVWRRSVRGRAVLADRGPLTWLRSTEGPLQDAWPECRWLADAVWECLGAPLHAGGIVLTSARNQLFYAVVPGGPGPDVLAVNMAPAAWGRLILARSSGGADSAAPLSASAHRIEAPASRAASLRVHAVRDARVLIVQVDANAFWVSGRAAHDDESWVEIGSRGRGGARVSVPELARGVPDLPVIVQLEEHVTIFGRVTSGGYPAAGAEVTAHRLGPGPGDGPGEKNDDAERRIAIATQIADAEGAFAFDTLLPEPVELLAMHSEFGRAVRRVVAGSAEVVLELRRPAQVTGRVVQGGVPLRGVPVRIVPDLVAFARSRDASEVLGGDTRTRADGRFSLAVPASGRSELRVGDGARGIRRIPLPSGDALPPVLDFGDIELEPRQTITFVLEPSDGCELVLAGPMGSAGLEIVRARRVDHAMFEARLPEAGRWSVVATCGGAERHVVPPTIEAAGDSQASTVQLAWR